MFENKEIAAQLADIHDTFVVVPAKNVVLVSKNYIQCLKIKELGMASNGEQNKTHHDTKLSKQGIFLITNQFFHHMVYRLQIRIRILRYYIGYLNCTKIRIKYALLFN